MDRLGNEIRSLQLQGADGQFHLTVACDDYHFGIGLHCLDATQNLDAVHPRHLYVRKHKRRQFTPKDFQSLLTAFGNPNHIAGIPKGNGHDLADTLFVVNQKDVL